MPIKMSCPNPTCRKSLTARDEMAGRKVRCAAGGGRIGVPAGNAGNGGLDQLEEVQAGAPRRRPGPPPEEDVQAGAPRRRPSPEDDYDDYDRPARRAPAGGGLFASKGLSGAGTIFLFVGVGMLLVLAISTFFPWRAIDRGARASMPDHDALAFAQFPDFPDVPKGMPKVGFPKGGGGFDMPGIPGLSLTQSGVGIWGGLISLILALLGITFVMVALFVLNQTMLKVSLWTAFGISIVGMAMGLLSALVKGTASASLGGMTIQGPTMV